MTLDSFLYSNIGGRRENQDAVGSREAGDSGLYVVADGLGGHQAGHLAAQCAVRTLTAGWSSEKPETPELLREQFIAVNQAILALQRETGLTTKTTAAALSVHGERAVWAHTGDSRIYFLRGGELASCTEDHSVAFKKYKAGEITREQIPQDEDQCVLLRALGGPRRFEPYTAEAGNLRPGDAFLLCTDGMWEYLLDGEIVSDCRKAASAREWAELLLLRAAKRIRPGNDNLSLITVLLKG